MVHVYIFCITCVLYLLSGWCWSYAVVVMGCFGPSFSVMTLLEVWGTGVDPRGVEAAGGGVLTLGNRGIPTLLTLLL